MIFKNVYILVLCICDNISMSLGWLWSFHVSMARQMLMRYSKQNKLNSERRVLRRTIHMSLQTSNKSLFLNTKLHKTLFDEALFYLKSSPEDLFRFLRIYLILPPQSSQAHSGILLGMDLKGILCCRSKSGFRYISSHSISTRCYTCL